MVLRMLFMLLKLDITEHVTASFLIKGHTKNDCDRLFNQMKKVYRKSNVYVPAQLMDAMKQPKVTPVWVDHSCMFKWSKMLDKYTADIPALLSYHVFDYKKKPYPFLFLSQAHGRDAKDGVALIKAKYRSEDKDFWQTVIDGLEPIAAVGMKDIKWVELYDKWGPLIPEEYKQQWKFYNTDPGKERRDKVKANKKKSKEQRVARTTTK